MAKQTGIIKLKGKIGDLSFYKTKDGHLAREKGGVDGDRIKNDPAFIRTRENGAEFGSAASAGKFTRDSLRPIALNASDNRIVSRMTKLMTQIKNLDTSSLRGERTVGTALASAQAKAMLKGFEFNKNALLSSILYKPWTVNVSTNEITIPSLTPVNDITFPTGATDFSISAAVAVLDYNGNIADVVLSNVASLPIDATSTSINLVFPSAPTGTGVVIYLLKIEFSQLVNGNYYSLKNGAHNALQIVEVI